MTESNISQVLNTVADAVKANTDGYPFRIAQALLKIAAMPDYNLNDSVVIGNPVAVSDTSEFGVLSGEIIAALDSCGTKSAYFMPTDSGTVKVTSEDWTVGGAEYAVVEGRAYKYVVGQGLIEV